jgi:AraC-like DNA-binding protein
MPAGTASESSFTMRFVERKPPPHLAPFIEGFWYFEGSDFAHSHERILPTGRMQLLVNLHEDELRSYHDDGVRRIHGAGLCGLHARHFGIDTAEQRRIAGVNFTAGGAFPFFRPPASATTEEHVGLDALWARDGELVRERLLERATPAAILEELERIVMERAARELTFDPGIALALDALERGMQVAALHERLGTSAKRFIRRFEDVVGLTPKRYARIRRFRRVIASIELGRRIDWAKVAVLAGYYDQAHLIHDFREFSGMSPTAYRPRAPGDRTHVPL